MAKSEPKSSKKPFKGGRSHLTAQNQINDYWDKKFRKLINEIKREVGAVIDGNERKL